MTKLYINDGALLDGSQPLPWVRMLGRSSLMDLGVSMCMNSTAVGGRSQLQPSLISDLFSFVLILVPCQSSCFLGSSVTFASPRPTVSAGDCVKYWSITLLPHL